MRTRTSTTAAQDTIPRTPPGSTTLDPSWIPVQPVAETRDQNLLARVIILETQQRILVEALLGMGFDIPLDLLGYPKGSLNGN